MCHLHAVHPHDQSPFHLCQANSEINLLYLFCNLFDPNCLTSKGEWSVSKGRCSTRCTLDIKLYAFHQVTSAVEAQGVWAPVCPFEASCGVWAQPILCWIFLLPTSPITLEVTSHSSFGHQASDYISACVCAQDPRWLLCMMKQVQIFKNFQDRGFYR